LKHGLKKLALTHKALIHSVDEGVYKELNIFVLMRLIGALQSFLRADWAFRWLLIQVMVLLGLGRLSVLLFPFRKIALWLGKTGQETGMVLEEREISQLTPISSAIEAVSKYTPWKSNCFAQALCAHWILVRRHIAHTVYFGVAKEGKTKMKAHAWLRAGERIVSGRKGHKEFAVVGKFAHH
jgi:hypothetical protein